MRTCNHFFKWIGVFVVVLFLVSASIAADDCTAVYGSGPHKFSLATGSPGELGLLKELAEVFSKEYLTEMCWKMEGSGKSLELLKEKKVDLILVHAPAAEKQAMQEGWAVNRTLIGSNEFYIVGPKNDPAGISQAESAADAFSRIAAATSKFLSRGDNSGTHKKEMFIWEKAGINPSGDWYIVTSDFMMGTLKKADELSGYFMTDSSTWVAVKKDLPNLVVLFRGDPVLINTYHGLCQPEGATKGQPFAARFLEFLKSDKGQHIIGTFGKDKYGEAMYNDAEYARQYEH